MSKYICEVNKDENNNELELVHAHKYNAIVSNNGGIKFPDKKTMNTYFKDRCVSVESLKKSNENNIFTFLFWILLFIFIITLLLQLFSKNKSSISTGKANLTAFGKFNF